MGCQPDSRGTREGEGAGGDEGADHGRSYKRHQNSHLFLTRCFSKAFLKLYCHARTEAAASMKKLKSP
ncbi:unnamed protein product [Urochloa humidicola]